MTVWEFRNQSIPLTVWEDKRAAIEAALDVSIVKIIYGKSKSRVLMYAVSAGDQTCRICCAGVTPIFPKDSFVLTLGESLYGACDGQFGSHPPHSAGRLHGQRKKRTAESCCSCNRFTRGRGLYC